MPVVPQLIIGPVPQGGYSYATSLSEVEIIEVLEEVLSELKEKRKNIN